MKQRKKICFTWLILEVFALWTTTEADYVGCYKEDRKNGRILNFNPAAFNPNILDSSLCTAICGAYSKTYAALAAGKMCFCGNTLTGLELDAGETYCNMPCPGDGAEMCGSDTHINVYDAIIPISRTDTTPSATVVSKSSAVTLSADVTTAATSWSMSLDYGDQAGMTPYFTHTDFPNTRTFYQSGEYRIRSYASNSDQTLPSVQSAAYVKVVSPVGQISVICPTNWATHQLDHCTVVVSEGTDIDLTVQYNNGANTVQKNLLVADAMEFAIGTAVRAKLLPGDPAHTSGTATNGLIINHAASARISGVLLGFEYFAVTSGTVDFYILSPMCNNEYCYEKHTCVSSGACQTSCAGDTYCSGDQVCATSCPPLRSTSVLGSYIVSHKELNVAVSQGYGFYDLSSTPVAVSVGDVVAHSVSGAATLAKVAPGTGEVHDVYCSSFFPNDGEQFSGSNCAGGTFSSLSTELHQIKAVASMTSNVLIPLIFTQPGSVTLTVTGESRHTEVVGQQSDEVTFLVEEGIDKAMFNLNPCVATNEAFEVTLQQFTGTPASIEFDMGDGGAPTTVHSSSLPFSHTYTTTGTFQVSVNISNTISYKDNTTNVCVQDRMVDFSISADAIVPTETAIPIRIGMSSGSDYTCDFTINGGSTPVSLSTTSSANPINSDYYYTFPSAAVYSVICVCTNGLDSVSSQIQVEAVEAVSGVRLSKAGANVTEPFYIKVLYDKGSDVTFTVQYDGADVAVFHHEHIKTVVAKDSITEITSGTHTVTVTSVNGLGSDIQNFDFSVEQEIADPDVVCTFSNPVTGHGLAYDVIKTGESVTCTVSMNAGATSVRVYIDWGCSLVPFIHQVSQGNTWSSNPLTGPVSVTFSSPGFCQMYVELSNFESIIYPFHVMVVQPVDGVTINSIAPVIFHPPASVVVDLHYPGNKPNLVNLTFNWGDNDVEILVDYDLDIAKSHEYRYISGDLTLEYTVENLVSSISGTVPISLVSPIVVNPPYLSFVGTPGVGVDIQFAPFRAAISLDLTFTCGNDAGDVIGPRPRTSTVSNGVDSEQCVYANVGTYITIIRAISTFEDLLFSHTVIIENPVVESEVVVVTSSPAIVCDNMLFDVNYAGSPFPTDAKVQILFGDGSLSTEENLAGSVSFTHTYGTFGTYTVEVRVWNLASYVTKKIQCGCYEDFTEGTMQVLWKPYLPLGGPDIVGNGPLEDTFVGGNPLKIHVSWTTGTEYLYDITASNALNTYTCNTTEEGVLTFDLPFYGTFNLTVMAQNPRFTSIALHATVTITQPISEITVTDFGILTNALSLKSFQISFESFDSTMCLAIHNGQDSEWMLYGLVTTCQNTVYWDNGTYFSDPFTNDFNVAYVYNTKGYFTMDVFAFNTFSSNSTSFSFDVSGVECRPPKIDIEDQHAFSNYPKLNKRSERLTIRGIVEITCHDTLNNDKEWTCEKWDPAEDKLIETIPLQSVSSASKTVLVLEPRFLECGFYKFTYKVTMKSDTFIHGEKFLASKHTFVEIVQSDLTVLMFQNGVSLLSVGPNEDVTLDARRYSYDPDAIGSDDVFSSFSMKCRDSTLNEAWPDPDIITLTTDHTQLPSGHINAGGCYQQGPGTVGPFDGQMTFNTAIMTVGHVYEMIVRGEKDTRTASVIVRLEVMAIQPPKPVIGFKVSHICKDHPLGKEFRPNTQLAMVGSTEDTCDTCEYAWEMAGYNYEWADVPDVNGWMPIPEMPSYIDGVVSDELTVYPEVFSRFDGIEQFRVRVTVSDTATGGIGRTEMILVRNSPPYGGSCTISPLIGTAFQTSHTVTCSGFTDDKDSVMDHTVYCITDGRKYIIASLNDGESVTLNLTMGNENENYVLDCYVSVTDSVGSVGTYHVANVTSNPIDSTVARQMFSDQAADLRDQTKILAAIGDLNGLVGVASSISAMDAILSNAAEYTDYANAGMAVSHTPSGFNTDTRTGTFIERTVQIQIGDVQPTGLRFVPNAAIGYLFPSSVTHCAECPCCDLVITGLFTTAFPDEASLERYEEERENSVVLKHLMATCLEKSTVEGPADLEKASNVVAMLTQSPENVGRKSQESLANVIENMAAKIDDIFDEELSFEQVKDWTTNLLEASGKIIEATSLFDGMPSNVEMEEMEGPVPYFPSNMDTETDDVYTEPGASAEAIKNAGKRILNSKEQRKSGTSTQKKVTNAIDRLLGVIGKKRTKSDNVLELSVSTGIVQLLKTEGSKLAGKEITNAGGGVTLPSLDELFDDPSIVDQTMVLQVWSSTKAPGDWNSGGRVGEFSRVVRISLKDENGYPIQVKNSKSPIPVFINQDEFKPEEEISTEYEEPVIIEDRHDYLYIHTVTVETPYSSIHIEFQPDNRDDNQLLILCTYNDIPDIRGGKVDFVTMVPTHSSQAGIHVSSTEPNPYTVFIDSDLVAERTGVWKCGIRQLQVFEFDMYTTLQSLPTSVPGSWINYKKFEQKYILNSYCATCAAAQDGSISYSAEGLKVGPLTSSSKIQCLAYHLTSFAGGWVVAPNTIDWNFVFSNADFLKNPTLYITEIVIVVVYIIAMIWARRQDKADVEKLGLAPLLDNDPQDKYYYEIMVSTGMRRNAGTASKVHFLLTGEEDETEVRTFTDNKRKIFQRGNQDGFLLAVPNELGALMYLRIWHDNSGKGREASWYLNHIVIRDVQKDKRYFFIANKWFAVEEDDGQVDRVIPVAGKEQMTEFSHLFAERASKNLSDGHLWFSVLARPPQSRFTRTQRVSCCLCLLFMTMLADAMFYGQDTASSNVYTFGPFALSPEQLFIGVACNLLIFPVNFLIITLFRKSRPRKKRPSRVELALKAKPERTTSMTDVNPQMRSSCNVDRPGSSFLMDSKRCDTSMSRPDSSMSTVTGVQVENRKCSKSDKKCQLPWWFRIVAWILLWAAVLVSAAFVTFYGIQFQDMKCKKWITSMLVSFFTSVFVTQPIKVFLFAIFFSLIIKNPGGREDEDDDEEECKLSPDDELLHKQEEDVFGFAAPRRAMYKPKPPNQKALEKAREQRMKEIKMWAVIREIVFYAFFLWILMVISYKSVSTESYYYKYSMEQVFILTNDTNHSFKKVKNTDDFWVWAQSGLLRGLRAGPYYNNYPPFFMRGYINDKVSRLMGYAVMRQVRIRPNTCKLPHQVMNIINECNGDFEMEYEERGSFAPGWKPLTNPNNSREEFTYMNAESLNGYPYMGEMAVYGGGGYIVRLNQDYFDMVAQLRQLQSENWIDKYTRAVFVEFTVYNPAINLFSVSTLLSEFRPSGGVFPTYRFEPCLLLSYVSSVLIFQIACEIAYLLFTIWFVVNLFRQIYRERLGYFKQFWNLVELCICAMSVTAIVIYFYRLVEVNQLTSYFSETSGNSYMKFQYVGYWSELFNYIIGFLVFLASLKFLKLLRFNKRISLLASTLKNSGKDLIHFSIIFNIVFLAFIQLFYLVYVANLNSFKTFVGSWQSGIVMMMGKFDIYNMLMVNQWFTQVFIFLFVVTITFIVVNMFLSILNETFGAVRSDAAKQANDYEIVDFMLNRFKLWTGLGAAANTTVSPADKESERERHYRTIEGQIDYFPDQIDRFLNSISHMYMEKVRFDDFLRKGAYGKMSMKAQMSQPQQRHPAPGAVRLSHGAYGMTDVQTD